MWVRSVDLELELSWPLNTRTNKSVCIDFSPSYADWLSELDVFLLVTVLTRVIPGRIQQGTHEVAGRVWHCVNTHLLVV